MELQNRFVQLVPESNSAIVNKGKQLLEYEEKTKELLAKVIGLERKKKDEKVVEGKKLVQTLAKDNEWLNSKFSVDYQLSRDNKNEKNILMAELEHFNYKAGGLQEELQKKTNEVEEGRQLRAQLQQQIVWNDTEMSKNKQCLKECEEDNNLLMDKIIGLKLKNNELMVNHGDTSEAPCDTAEVNNIRFNGSLEDVKEANLIQAPSSDSPTSSFLVESNSPSNLKFATFAGTKWAASCSRDTWSRQCLVEKVDELEDELRGEKQKVADGKELAQNLVKKIDWLLSET
ncbi:hypothetical protein CFP56_007286 [Quercus suber]|uniref:Uncharacterized protein n=1 Tax=Quercus suber TaxID=58331 RepID=A0AAW0L6L0_QUESU